MFQTLQSCPQELLEKSDPKRPQIDERSELLMPSEGKHLSHRCEAEGISFQTSLYRGNSPEMRDGVGYLACKLLRSWGQRD